MKYQVWVREASPCGIASGLFMVLTVDFLLMKCRLPSCCRRRFFGGVGLLLVYCSSWTTSYACKPLPVLLYPADEEYRRKGLEIPDLPDDSVALINGTYIPKADYKDFLYEKIGFDSKIRREFVVNRSLKERLQANGVDTDVQKNIILENSKYFDSLGVCRSLDDWVAMLRESC